MGINSDLIEIFIMMTPWPDLILNRDFFQVNCNIKFEGKWMVIILLDEKKGKHIYMKCVVYVDIVIKSYMDNWKLF